MMLMMTVTLSENVEQCQCGCLGSLALALTNKFLFTTEMRVEKRGRSLTIDSIMEEIVRYVQQETQIQKLPSTENCNSEAEGSPMPLPTLSWQGHGNIRASSLTDDDVFQVLGISTITDSENGTEKMMSAKKKSL